MTTPSTPTPERMLVLAVIDSRGPMTDMDIAHLTGRKQDNIRRHRNDCCKARWVTAIGTAKVGHSVVGIWKLTQEGKQMLQQQEHLL